ncbi:MAG: peptidylprolyl isomerase [Pseudomonadales bacterium]|jgi:peptidyl-prolyl cis-trans isomerase SurA
MKKPLIALLLLLAPTFSWAEYRELDAIVAIVEDDVVLASELLERLDMVREQFKDNNAQLPPNDILLSQIMERLIIESLQVQEAERRGLVIDDETLTRAVTAFAAQNNMTLEQFAQQLEQDGRNYAEFREQIRKEMIMQRLQQAIVNRRISISEQDVDDLLSSPYYKQLLSDEFRVGHILLAVEPDASDETVQAAKDAAKEIVTELRDGADFTQMAVSRSAGSHALEGGDLGWRKAAELPTLFAELVVQMNVGDVSDPIPSPSGFHVIKLLDRRGAGVQTETQTKLRHILVMPSEIRTEEETEALIRDIYQRLEAGADFAELAAEYSEDPGSALAGGELGWTSGDEFVPKFQEVMAATPTGSLSEPFRSQYGWHILEVEDRREQDMSDEARRDMALKILHGRRFEEELDKWLKELRDEAFVEIRLGDKG